jgi:hypothetical protein
MPSFSSCSQIVNEEDYCVSCGHYYSTNKEGQEVICNCGCHE